LYATPSGRCGSFSVRTPRVKVAHLRAEMVCPKISSLSGIEQKRAVAHDDRHPEEQLLR
jgi:hypothetical protein